MSIGLTSGNKRQVYPLNKYESLPADCCSNMQETKDRSAGRIVLLKHVKFQVDIIYYMMAIALARQLEKRSETFVPFH